MNNCFAGASFALKNVPFGLIYVDSETNEFVTQNEIGIDREGKACAISYMGWIVTGDASVKTAMKKSEISKIAVIDQKYKNILQAFAEYCIIVKGE